MKVWIDPGHGGSASGAVNGSRMEKDDALRISKLVDTGFKRCGIDTVMTRSRDVFVSLKERTDIENKNNCSLAISIHRNSAAADAYGTEIWMHSKAPASYINWGKNVLCGLESVGISKNRGVKKGYIGDSNADYAVNRDTKSPSMMIELGFISNDGDNRDFDKYIEEYAEAVVKASCEYLGVKYVPKRQTDDGHGNVYRVQIGAFESRQNAEKLRDELKKKGYPAFIA